MPSRRNLPAPQARKQPSPPPARQAQIEKQRSRLLDELTVMRDVQGGASPALETVRQLLTRQWIKADWRERGRLIKAADWMLRVESVRGPLAPA